MRQPTTQPSYSPAKYSHPRLKPHRSSVDSVWAISWMTDVQGYCTSVTQSWCEFTGRSQDQSIGAGWLRNVHALDSQRVQNELNRAHQAQQPIVMEYRLRRVDGHYSWVQHDGQPQFDHDGRFIGLIHVAVDFVGVQRLEQALMETQSAVRQQRDLATALLDVMTVVNAHENMTASLEFVMDQALHMLNAQIGVLYQFLPERGCLQVQSSIGLPAPIGRLLSITLGQGTAGRTAQQRRAMTLDSLEGEALEQILAQHPELWECVIGLTQSVARSLAAPIQVHGKLLGVLAVYRRDSQGFSEDEITLLSALGIQAALVIQSNLKQNAHMSLPPGAAAKGEPVLLTEAVTVNVNVAA